MEKTLGGERMIVSVAHNILSPLGMTSAENYAAVKAGRSMLNGTRDFGVSPSLS